MNVRAVITAGGRVESAFAAVIGTQYKALAPYGAGVLIDPVIAALRACGITDIAIVAGDEVAAVLAGRGLRIVAAADTGAANVARALEAWTDGDIVYATSDLPFIRAAALDVFLAASAAHDLTLPLADGAAYETAFPRAPAHVMAIGGERVANGSIFFISARARTALATIAGRFFDARKSAIGMARLLGPGLLVRYAVRRLRIGDVEARAAAALGIRAAAIREASPELCYDVDTLDDYRYACAQVR